MASVETTPAASRAFCTQCGRQFAVEDLARFGSNLVCADCKPRFVQQVREGAPTGAQRAFVYGGFWRRFVAILIDGVIVAIPYFLIEALIIGPMMASIVRAPAPASVDPAAMFSRMGLIWIIGIVLNLAYQGYFLSQKSATPGKMIMGLKVITPGGGRISVGRAIGRYFGYWVDGLTLCIGYIIAAFDSEKRALHDYICGTRVIQEL